MDSTKVSGLKARLIAPENRIPFILVTALFLFWGIPNNLNDILIKQFMKSFEITRLEAGLIQSAFYMGYFLLAVPAAMIMRKYSYKVGLITGMFLYSIGTFLFWPAAHSGQYLFFLFALFVIASGLSFLETGANPFIAGLGNPESSERRLNFSQAFNPFGAILGVLIGTIFIFSGIEHDQAKIEMMKQAGEYSAYLESETMRVVRPYMVLGVVIFLWALLIMRTKFPVIAAEEDNSENKGNPRELLKYRHFLTGVLAQFCYVGAQVGTWSYFIQYAQDYTGIAEKSAGFFLTGTLVAFLIGRFSATVLMKYIKPGKLMGIYGIMNILLISIAVIFPGWLGVWSIFLSSFFMSLMFPTIFALGIKGLGANTKIAGSVIVMAIIGGGVFTPLMGLIASDSMAHAMLIPLGCYCIIVFYAFWWSHPVPLKIINKQD
ncbi:MAG: L-fucose:H+ symporter permease [Bacteroidales bacterium]|nr:L-fucose:H+ symporter permease [Bacteroidales bacterium]